MKSYRINSLTGLRVIAMMTIFCCHLSYLEDTPFRGFYSWMDNGRLGVNFFFVLSGFVLALGYGTRLSTNNVSRDLHFVGKRISKIYIPYLMTLILAIPLYIVEVALREGTFHVGRWIGCLVINIGMMQSIIPLARYSVSINEVSWFASTICMIYLLTPVILRLNHKVAKHVSPLSAALLVFGILVVHCCVYMVILRIEYVWFADYGLSIIYRSPLIRIFPFLLGVAACDIYGMRGTVRSGDGSFAEIVSIAVFLLWWITADRTGLPTVVTECIDMLVSMAVVLVFAWSTGGIVSRFLSGETMLALGNISLDFYLLHRLVNQYGVMAAKTFRPDPGMAALPAAVLFLAISLYGAGRIHSFSGWLWLHVIKNKWLI